MNQRTATVLAVSVLCALALGAALAAKSPNSTSEKLKAQVTEWDKDSKLARQMSDYILTQTKAAQDRLPVLDSAATWRNRKAEIRRKLLKSYGLDPIPARTPLNAKIVGVIDYPDYRLEKITYEAWPGVPVSAHFYLPKGVSGPLSCVLYSCGHWYNGKTDVEVLRPFPVGMVRHGIAVLIYDPIGEGERYVADDHGHRFPILSGLSQEGFIVWESMRAIDYILSRPEIDPKRIGMTGASGGGTNTIFTSAVENRLAAAAPVVSAETYDEMMHAMDGRNWNGGVDLCNQVPGVISYARTSDLMACFAPKPQLQISATKDTCFTIAGARQTADEVKKLYSLVSPGNFQYAEFDAEHSYDQKMRETAYGFFLKCLAGKGDGSPVAEAPMQLEKWDDPKLRCFPDGNKIAGERLPAFTEKLMPSRPEFSKVPARGELAKWQAELSARVSQLCGVPTAAYTVASTPAQSAVIDGIELRKISLKSEDEITVPLILAGKQGTKPSHALIIISNGAKADILGRPYVRGFLERGFLVCAADVRGTGESKCTDFEISTDLWMLDETMAGGRIADIRAITTFLKRGVGLTRVSLIGTEGLAETAILAAAVVPEIDSVLADNPLGTYRDLIAYGVNWDASVYIPGALLHFDLPTLLAAVAPRKAIVLGPVGGSRQPMPESRFRSLYSIPTTAYRSAGAPDALRVMHSVPLDYDEVVSSL